MAPSINCARMLVRASKNSQRTMVLYLALKLLFDIVSKNGIIIINVFFLPNNLRPVLFGGDNMTLKESIVKLFTEDKTASLLLEKMETTFDVIILGGAVRDFVYLEPFMPRDIDIVLVPKTNASLDDLLYKYYNTHIEKNHFGGYKIFNKEIDFDIWLLENTWAFKNGILKASIENLLKSVYLNIDCYAYFYNQNQYICDCDKYPLPSEIEIVLDDNPYHVLNFIRAIFYSSKYCIPVSECLKKNIIAESESDQGFPDSWVNIQMAHFRRILFNKQELRDIIFSYKGAQNAKFVL